MLRGLAIIHVAASPKEHPEFVESVHAPENRQAVVVWVPARRQHPEKESVKQPDPHGRDPASESHRLLGRLPMPDTGIPQARGGNDSMPDDNDSCGARRQLTSGNPGCGSEL